MEHLKGASISQALALLTSIRLDWKGLPGTSTLAYYMHSHMKAITSFTTLVPGVPFPVSAVMVLLLINNLIIFYNNITH